MKEASTSTFFCDHLLVCRALARSEHKSAHSRFNPCSAHTWPWVSTNTWDNPNGNLVSPDFGTSSSTEPLFPQKEWFLSLRVAASTLQPLYQHYKLEEKAKLTQPPGAFLPPSFPWCWNRSLQNHFGWRAVVRSFWKVCNTLQIVLAGGCTITVPLLKKKKKIQEYYVRHRSGFSTHNNIPGKKNKMEEEKKLLNTS